MSEQLLNPDKERCNRCGKVAEGFAFIGGRRYCHGDRFSGTCYEYSSSELIGVPRYSLSQRALDVISERVAGSSEQLTEKDRP